MRQAVPSLGLRPEFEFSSVSDLRGKFRSVTSSVSPNYLISVLEVIMSMSCCVWEV